MQNRRLIVKLLLLLHLFVFCVWLYLFHASEMPPEWMFHVVVLSLIGIQFTWGLTVGLMIGPSRKRRVLLWFSLLPIFLPGAVVGELVRMLFLHEGPFIALLYLVIFAAILACETFGGVMLGAKLHSKSED